MVLDGITGMHDGIDRDADGRIWLALFTERGRLLTWMHAHAWAKSLVLRLPTPAAAGGDPAARGCSCSAPTGAPRSTRRSTAGPC